CGSLSGVRLLYDQAHHSISPASRRDQRCPPPRATTRARKLRTALPRGVTIGLVSCGDAGIVPIAPIWSPSPYARLNTRRIAERRRRSYRTIKVFSLAEAMH
ncbi:MAG: hypothetical protein AVDCRST_MAG18-4087, partial [uncultured Thermomicrobiales bacterium]